MKAAFNNYGTVDTILFMSDGYPNTALSRGCRACGCSQSAGWILNDSTGWIAAQVADNPTFKLMVIQVGGSPMGFMTSLGAKQNSEFHLK